LPRLFSFDDAFALYRRNKQACRAERLGKYVLSDPTHFSPAIAEAATRLLLARLDRRAAGPVFANRHRRRRTVKGAGSVLECRLTGERIVFDARARLVAGHGPPPDPPYRDAFDALCCQVMEDIAVVACGQRDSGDDRIVALHLCAPSRWRAEDKIGRSFAEAHAPVPGMERSRQTSAARALMDAAVHRGPWVRFAWGITADNASTTIPTRRPAWIRRVARPRL
jgi:hypothetical protein